MIRRIARAPALHFLVLGALLLAAERRPGRQPAGPIPPDEELLAAEAIALGVDRTDEAVRTRLARLGRFVGEDAESEAAVEAEARRLGIDRSDIVVRRHLASMMRLAAGHLAPSEGPTEADLQAYLAAHAGEFAVPERWRFTHVYVGRGHDGADAERLFARVRDEETAPAQAAALGDGFIGGASVGPATVDEIDRRFGPGFGARVAAGEAHAWIGPIRSSYGLHLVWIDERVAGGVPPLDAVRGRVVHRWLRERGAARADERMAALRARASRD
jgi:peptidyl-prolyl cis-trans isomerase C